MSDNSFGTTFGPSAPGAINVVSGDTGGVDTTRTQANNPSVATRDGAERRPHARRARRLLADERRAAVLGRLLDARRGRAQRHEHRRRAERGRPLVGLVPGRLPADDDVRRRGGRDRPRRAVDRDVHPGRVLRRVHRQGRPDRRLEPGALRRRPPGRGRVRRHDRADRAAEFGFKDDYIAHHEPFEYYASTANPHHLGVATDAAGTTRSRPGQPLDVGDRHAVVLRPLRHGRSSTRRTTTTTRATSTSSSRRSTPGSCRRRRCRPSRSSRRPATRTATPPTPTRPTSRRSSSTRSTR